MRQATLIYNPLAGPVNLSAAIKQLTTYWLGRRWQVTVQATEFAGHATTLARQAVKLGHELVLAAGGDGTLGEVVNGLAGTNTIMAPLPVGTANSFAKELGMPRPGIIQGHRLQEAAESLAEGRVQAMDLGYSFFTGEESRAGSNGRFWLLWTGTGADGYLVHELEPRPKWAKRIGPLGYALHALAVAPTLPDMHARVEIDGRIYEDDYILIVISNCRMYGGEVILSPEARVDDGLFETWLFKGKGLPKTVTHITHVIRGEHLNVEDVMCVRSRSVSVYTTPIFPCHTDGDYAGYSPFFCEIRPSALRLLAPGTAPSDLFCQPGTPL